MPLPSGFEWVLIIGLALLILGPGKLPEVAASLGKSIREFRKASADVADAVRIDPSPAGAGPAQVTQATQSTPDQATPQSQPAQVHPTPQTSAEPQVQQPIAPVAPAAAAMPPVVTAPEDPQPVPDASPTDVAPTSNG